MLMLVAYDVRTETPASRRRLRRVARACLDYGQRVQHSVFECEVYPAQWTELRARLISEIDAAHDSLRFIALVRMAGGVLNMWVPSQPLILMGRCCSEPART